MTSRHVVGVPRLSLIRRVPEFLDNASNSTVSVVPGETPWALGSLKAQYGPIDPLWELCCVRRKGREVNAKPTRIQKVVLRVKPILGGRVESQVHEEPRGFRLSRSVETRSALTRAKYIYFTGNYKPLFAWGTANCQPHPVRRLDTCGSKAPDKATRP
jgi:hypothetical protein